MELSPAATWRLELVDLVSGRPLNAGVTRGARGGRGRGWRFLRRFVNSRIERQIR